MSLDRIHGDLVFTCDECDDTLETHEDDFETAREVFKQEGWKNIKYEGEWLNICPGCVK